MDSTAPTSMNVIQTKMSVLLSRNVWTWWVPTHAYALPGTCRMVVDVWILMNAMYPPITVVLLLMPTLRVQIPLVPTNALAPGT